MSRSSANLRKLDCGPELERRLISARQRLEDCKRRISAWRQGADRARDMVAELMGEVLPRNRIGRFQVDHRVARSSGLRRKGLLLAAGENHFWFYAEPAAAPVEADPSA